MSNKVEATYGPVSDDCPKCDSDLQGDPIPQEYIDAGYYRLGVTHYSRKKGYDFPAIYDGVLLWSCEDCGHIWPRFPQGTRLYTYAIEIIQGWGELKMPSLLSRSSSPSS